MNNSKIKKELREDVAKKIKVLSLVIKINLIVAVVITVLLSVFLIVDIVGMDIDYTLEAGEALPSATLLSRHNDAKYDFGDSDGEFKIPGEYQIYILYGNRKITVNLTVVDTKAPRAEILHLYVNVNGPYPSAMDFFMNVKDASEVTARFKNGINPSGVGDYEVHLELVDSYGNSRSGKTTMTLIEDREAPVISGPDTITGYMGEAVAFKKAVTVTDNCFGEVKLDIDSSNVDINSKGRYKVKYIATDAAGNYSEFELTVEIVEERITEEKLMEKIGLLASNIGISKSMTKEEQVKMIYGYVNSPRKSSSEATIVFTDKSNTDRSDWVREAYLTIQNGQGDCYSYFALSKAFFEYFGIENRDIQRTPGVTKGTHFWSMVNIGSEKNARWYYYDATRLRYPHNEGSGCLFTESQLQDYTQNVSEHFLDFDRKGYPKASEEKINTGYSW